MIKKLHQFFERQLLPTETHPGHHSQAQLRLATAALLLEMTRVDHDIQESELDTVARALQATFSLTSEETDELLRLADNELKEMTSYFPFTSLINKHYSPQEKVKIVELMWQVAFTDDKLDKYEEHLIRKIANLLYVPREEIVAAKHRALRS